MTREQKHRIYAVTLNWNSCSDTIQCVHSLKGSEQGFAQIVVVDNGSTDGSGTSLASTFAGDDQVRVVQNQQNEGFACGMNKAMALALSEGATHIFILNNDASIDKGCLTSLLEIMDNDERAGAASPTVFYARDPQKIWHGAGYFSRARANVVVPYKNTTLPEQVGEPQEATFLSGCALLLSTKMVRDIGMFDGDFFLYGEDVELSLRAVRNGYKLLYVPGAYAWHAIDDMNVSRTTAFVMYHRARSSVILFRKAFRGAYRAYALFLHFFLYTPYRLWQCRNSKRPIQSFAGWIRGSLDGLVSSTNRSMA